MSVPKFSSAAQSFHGELKKRINIYFKEKGKSSTGNSGLFFKAIFLLTGFIGIYIHLVFFTPPAFWAVLECLLLGGFTAGIGFNIMHDGSHGSFSKYKILNKLASLSANLMGADNFMWKTKHNIVHHTYTNIHGIDDDIEARPLLRLCSDQKFYKIHKSFIVRLKSIKKMGAKGEFVIMENGENLVVSKRRRDGLRNRYSLK